MHSHTLFNAVLTPKLCSDFRNIHRSEKILNSAKAIIDQMEGTIKKWKVALLLFYKYFDARKENVTISDLFYYGRSMLANYGILTENSLNLHTRILAKRYFIHTIRNRGNPVNYTIPYRFLISKSGLERLTFENLISQRDQERLAPYVHWEARENGIRVRG